MWNQDSPVSVVSLYWWPRRDNLIVVTTVEASETRGTTALVYCLISSSLYTGTVQGWWSTLPTGLTASRGEVHPNWFDGQQGCSQLSTKRCFYRPKLRRRKISAAIVCRFSPPHPISLPRWQTFFPFKCLHLMWLIISCISGRIILRAEKVITTLLRR